MLFYLSLVDIIVAETAAFVVGFIIGYIVRAKYNGKGDK